MLATIVCPWDGNLSRGMRTSHQKIDGVDVHRPQYCFWFLVWWIPYQSVWMRPRYLHQPNRNDSENEFIYQLPLEWSHHELFQHGQSALFDQHLENAPWVSPLYPTEGLLRSPCTHNIKPVCIQKVAFLRHFHHLWLLGIQWITIKLKWRFPLADPKRWLLVTSIIFSGTIQFQAPTQYCPLSSLLCDECPLQSCHIQLCLAFRTPNLCNWASMSAPEGSTVHSNQSILEEVFRPYQAPHGQRLGSYQQCG